MYSSIYILRNISINLYLKLCNKQKLQNPPLSNVSSLKRIFHKTSDKVKELSNGTLVYSFKNDRFYKILSIFGVLQTVFWFNLASMSTQLPATQQNINFIADFQQKHKTKFAITGCFLGFNFITFVC